MLAERTRPRPAGLAGIGHFLQNRTGIVPVRTPELAQSVWYGGGGHGGGASPKKTPPSRA